MHIRDDHQAIEKIKSLADEAKIDISGAKIRRTSSRFCLGVEHGDYNGTALFGVGTDRFIWMAYKPNNTDTVRIFSGNFPEDGVVEFKLGKVPEPQSQEIADTWARFPYGVEYILRKNGYKLTQGIDAVIYGNIPGGGMSRSASLSLNLIISLFEVNEIKAKDQFEIVNLAQAVENDYIGSPCGKLDQIMIFFAKADHGTYYDPENEKIEHIPLGAGADDFCFTVMDTGTVRPGLEKSTYKVRRDECQQLVEILKKAGYNINCLADVNDDELYNKITSQFADQYPGLCDRLRYIYEAQNRFKVMLQAWRDGDIETVGDVFRKDGIGLRDKYKISGPELETMCDIVRTVDGVLGERMLGGGDKGAAGCIVRAEAAQKVKDAVSTAYPRSRPDYADNFAVHVCKLVDGVKVIEGML